MSKIPTDLYYTEEHEYVKATDEDGVFLVGITDYAQGELGDVVFVELPDTGVSLDRMEVFGSIEAVKAVSDLYCPLKGEIVEVNIDLVDDPSLVNKDPYGDGWMIRLRIRSRTDLDTLLPAADYQQHIGE